jgi:hypothetical protein
LGSGTKVWRKEEEMSRRKLHRRVAALAVVAALGLAGSRPAAAVDLNLVNRLGDLWSAVAAGEPGGVWGTLTGWLGGVTKGGEDEIQPSTNHTHASDPNGGPHAVGEVPLSGSD